MLNLRALLRGQQQAARGFAELVPWLALVAPYAVVNVDGSVLGAWEFEGLDPEGRERADTDRVADAAERLLATLGGRCTLWARVTRRRVHDYPYGHFAQPVAAAIDRAWGKAVLGAGQYVNRHHLALMLSPPRGAQGWFEQLADAMRDGRALPRALLATGRARLGRGAAHAIALDELRVRLAELDATLLDVEQTLAAIAPRRLAGASLLQFLHACCSPANEEQPIALPAAPVYLNTWLPDCTLQRDVDLLHFTHVQSRAVAALSVKQYPRAAWPGALDALLEVPGEITVSQCFRLVDQAQARSAIGALEAHFRTASLGIAGVIAEALTGRPTQRVDRGQLTLAEDASAALAAMSADGAVYGFHNLTVLASGANAAECAATLAEAQRTLGEAQLVTVRETLHLLSVFAGSLPGQADALVRWFWVSTANVADLLHLRRPALGAPLNTHLSEQRGAPQPALTVLPTASGTPWFFNLHVHDLGHTFVVGPSRSGKSVLVNFLVAQFLRYAPCKVFVFDKDHSCRVPTRLLGGRHLDLGRDARSRPRLNPLKLLAQDADRPFLQRWLQLLLSAHGDPWTAEDDELLALSLDRLAAQPPALWRLGALAALLPRLSLAQRLAPWVGDGPHAWLFDHAEDDFTLGSHLAIELGGFLDDGRVATAFLDYAFHRIARELDGAPTLIYLEECWALLRVPQFAARIEDWLKTLAKKQALLVLATQSLSDLAASPAFASIVDNMKTRIFLPNAMAPAHADLYCRAFGLNAVQLERVRTATPKRHYYVVQDAVSRLVVLDLPPAVLAALRSDTRAQQAFDRHHGTPGWQAAYLAEMADAAA